MAANKFGYEQTEYRKTPYSFIVIEEHPLPPHFLLVTGFLRAFQHIQAFVSKLHFESYFRFPKSHKSV